MDAVWLSTRYYTDEKFDGMPAATERMFTRLMALAGALENEGQLPTRPWVFVGLPRGRAAVDDLVARRILIANPDGTYAFKAWAGWQSAGDEYTRRKRNDRQRKRRQRERERADRETPKRQEVDAMCVESVHKAEHLRHTFDTPSTHIVQTGDAPETPSDQGEQPVQGELMSRDMSQVSRVQSRVEESREQLRTETTSPNETRTRDTAGALALVPPLPERRPDGSRIPRQTRQQMLAALNDTSRSAAANTLVTQFEHTLTGTLDRKSRFEVGQVVDELLRDHIPEPQIVAGLAAWQASDSWSPTQIRRFVAKAARTHHTEPGTTEQRVAGWQAMKDPHPKGLDQ